MQAGAIAAIAGGRPLIGSFLYCASLSHKQMSLYYAPAFFAHLLGCCCQRRTYRGKLALLGSLAVIVVASIALLWYPYLTSFESATAVLARVFPLKRGLFEDYVANFWCVSSMAIKWKRLLQPDMLAKMCSMVTFVAFLPSLVTAAGNPTTENFLLCLFNTSMAFYMFSFQVSGNG